MAAGRCFFSAGKAEAAMRLRPPGGGTRPPDVRPPAEEKFVSIRQGPGRQEPVAQKRGVPRQGMLNMSDTPEINVGPRADRGRGDARDRVKNVARRPNLANIDENFAYSGEEDDHAWIQQKPRPRSKPNAELRMNSQALAGALPFGDPSVKHPGESSSAASVTDEDWERCDTSSMASWERCDTSSMASWERCDVYSMASWERCDMASMASSSWTEVGGEVSDEAPERHHDSQSECSDTSFLLVVDVDLQARQKLREQGGAEEREKDGFVDRRLRKTVAAYS